MKRKYASLIVGLLALMLVLPAAPYRHAAAADMSDTDADRELPELSPESTLSDYLLYAGLNNAEMEAAFHRWRAALERIPQAESLPDPRFTYRHFLEEVETRVGPQRNAFEISQMFPWFGKLELAGDVAAQAALAAKERYEAVKLSVFFEVKEAYYEYYYLARSIAVTQENLQLLQHAENVARARFGAAGGSHPDVIRAQVEIGKLEDQLATLRDLIEPIVARLNAAMNRPVEAPLPTPEPVEATEVTFDEDDLLKRLEYTNPQLQALGHDVERYRKVAELAKKQYAPDITIGLNYIDIGSSDRASRFSDNGQDAIGGMLSLNIPIWHKKYRSAVQEARLERTDATNRLKAQLQMALYRLRDAGRKLDLYADALIPKATESLEVTEQAFRAGDATFLDLIDAQRTYLEFELALAEALANHEKALARIVMLVGAELNEIKAPENDAAEGPEIGEPNKQ